MPKYLLAPISHKRTIETISVSKKFIHTHTGEYSMFGILLGCLIDIILEG